MCAFDDSKLETVMGKRAAGTSWRPSKAVACPPSPVTDTV